jgi:ligand-binding sensor domain-containing protein/serine phosphatase RsbU (regulator of sigma subunit)
LKQQLLAIFFILILTCKIFAQRDVLHTDLFGVDNEMPLTRTQALAIGKNGLLWVGTSDGLNFFDGNKFTVFRNQPLNSNSLCDNSVQSVCVSVNNNLWVGTSNGLSYYNARNGVFVNYYYKRNNVNTLSDNNVLIVHEDKKHGLWAQTSKALDYFDPNSHQFIHFPQIAQSITEDTYGTVWIGTKEGISRFDQHKQKFDRVQIPEMSTNLEIKGLFFDKRGKLWIATNTGFFIYSRKTKDLKRIWFTLQPENKVMSSASFVEDLTGQIWIGANDGLFCFNSDGRLVNSFYELSLRNTKQPFSILNTISCDHSNILWLATKLGLVKYDLKPIKFNLLQKVDDVSLVDITSVFAINNIVWLGTRNSGLFQYNLKTKEASVMQPQMLKRNGMDNASFLSLFLSKDYTMLLGTENGLYAHRLFEKGYYNVCSTVGEHFRKDAHHQIHKITETPDSLLLVGTDQGLHIFSDKLSKFVNLSKITDGNRKIELKDVYSISMESSHTVWLGTLRGLVYLDLKTNQGRLYPVSLNMRSNRNTIVYDIYNDKKDVLWLATSSGLAKFHKKLSKVEYVDFQKDAPISSASSILFDGNDNLWISSNKGLVKYSIATALFERFDITDGLQGDEFNPGAAFYEPSTKQMFFCGLSGFNYFYPDSVLYNPYKPTAFISSFDMVSGHEQKSVFVSGNGQNIILPSNVNSFTIEFASLDFTSPHKNRYAYRLIRNGRDTDWVEHKNRTSVTFTNLSAGKYRFEVKGTNNDGVWSATPAYLFFEIKSPWWLTGKAYTAYAIIVLFLIVLIVQLRTNSLMKSNSLLKEKEIAARKIEIQREELSIQNKNIRDSINYAKRLQYALIPSEKVLQKYLRNSFVYLKPKDIVSGDFIWVSAHGSRIILASVDCTGHGVPGAFMSVIGFELFRKITSTNHSKRADEILQLIEDEFISVFKDVDGSSIRDGMDVSLCCIDKRTGIVEYSGAFNPLYLLRDNRIEEFKGGRVSISLKAFGDDSDSKFGYHTVQSQPDDVFYIFTDGYADQFGGPEGKKFKYRRFRHLLLSIHQLPFEEQKKYIDESFNLWKRNLEQVDDILVIGFKVL